MVSLTDIAQQAEVSVSLVSRVLSNRMGNVGVTEEKQKRIRQIVGDWAMCRTVPLKVWCGARAASSG